MKGMCRPEMNYQFLSNLRASIQSTTIQSISRRDEVILWEDCSRSKLG